MNRKFTTIFCADVVGYSRLMGADEDGTLRQLDQCRKIIDPLIEKFSGRIFNTAGDSVLAEFPNPIDAVLFAAECQKQLAAYTMQWRMGIHMGDVILYGETLMGETVNLAARLESQADYGGVSISKTVYEAVAESVSIEFEERGPHVFKNIERPVNVYAIKIAGAKPNPHAQVEKPKQYTHAQLVKMVLDDRISASKSLTEANNLKRNGSYEAAIKIFLSKFVRRDLTAAKELTDLIHRGLIPESIKDQVASVFVECAKFFDSDEQYRIGCLFDSGLLGPEHSHKAFVYWEKAAEKNVDAAFSLGMGLLKDRSATKSELDQALAFLEKAARRQKVGAAVRLGDYYFYDSEGTEKDYAHAFQWYWVARHLKDAQSHIKLEALAQKMSRKDIGNAKIVAESLIDEIKWNNSGY